MKTIIKIAVVIAFLPLVCGCDAEKKSEETRSAFSLVRKTHDIYGNPCQPLRFNTLKKEDERDTAMKQLADQWNRNLHMRRPLIDVCRQDLSCHPAEHAGALLDVSK